jgi:hypothetical protein
MKKLVIALLAITALASCRLYDGPPKTDHLGPVPAAHDGVFVCGGDTLVFNGDGKTVSWRFSNPYDSLTVQGEGSYVFLLYNGKYRYDAAEEFSIYDGAKSHKFMTVAGQTKEDMIAFYVFDDDDNKDNDLKVFKKIEAK